VIPAQRETQVAAQLIFLEEDPPLAEIPLTAKEKRLIGEFYEEMKGV
jgi:hypothetical protein